MVLDGFGMEQDSDMASKSASSLFVGRGLAKICEKYILKLSASSLLSHIRHSILPLGLQLIQLANNFSNSRKIQNYVILLLFFLVTVQMILISKLI